MLSIEKRHNTICEAMIQQQNQSNLIDDLHIDPSEIKIKLLKAWKCIQIQCMNE